jgi:hypothetical protein
MPNRILILLLFFICWLPPVIVGRWFSPYIASKQHPNPTRFLIVATTAFIWTLIWAVVEISLLPPYVRQGPSNPGDAPAYVMIGIMTIALYLVFPVSLVACWIGTLIKRPLKFSLRTLLIASTLFAVALGLIVGAAR